MNKAYEYLVQHANELYLVDTKALEDSLNRDLEYNLTRYYKYGFIKYLLTNYQGFSLATFSKQALSFLDYLKTRQENDEHLINNEIARIADRR